VSALSDLSPDQRAVLQLLLKQGKTYGELAGLLRIDPAAVRERAAMALDALAGSAGDGLRDDEVDRLSDFVLGQGEEPPPTGARARAWVDTVGAALRDGGLEPKGDRHAPPPARDEPDAAAPQAAAPVPGPEPGDVPASEPAQPGDTPATLPGFGAVDAPARSSRAGGLALLAVLAVIVAGILVFVLTRGDDDGPATASVAAQTGTAAAAATTPTSTSTTPVSVEAQINMRPPSSGSKALGVATIITDGKTEAVQLQTSGLTPNGTSDLYALWLTDGSGKATLLGFQKTPVGKDGRFAGTASLPSNAGDYTRIVLSRETVNDPKKPANTVLRGSLK
jgi:hypothetical protein